ncbi:MAG: hypothetical protein PF590_03285 [Candidatus Delongbacteria bacterium]|jgi:hypothetical protein|nr:hypothetical protein [Candidatus Delongbacteria bacterium]
MKQFTKLIIALAITVGLTSCGGGSDTEVSEEMQGFMTKIENTNSIVDAAEAYGYEADEMPLDLYELKEPSVKSTTDKEGKTIYTMNVKHGMIDSDVKIIWEENEIVDIQETE